MVTLTQLLGKSQWLLYALDKRNKFIVFQRITCAQGAGKNDLTLCF
ncbi:hypothetical protein XBKB1_430028 [Xenorhabdus bovienii str. kraussei Becker Underwood]|uniref:Uncharacterized protein n=1 Tax=Xenorhabdus bovienii str. kraussei Becker Underwood TaxID=1398204 RepID=A0A077Q1S3_XENBV|nr:hypothetical protein XBKB1_430028 [Xenorhabdus bovienii str. kraussei Becker Underwood]